MAFCGKAECEIKIKELTNGGTARCIAEEAVKDGAPSARSAVNRLPSSLTLRKPINCSILFFQAPR
jgi:hypothetical protein